MDSYDEDLVRKLMEKIVIYDERLKVMFKSGIEIDINEQQIRKGSVFKVSDNGIMYLKFKVVSKGEHFIEKDTNN